MLLFHYFVCVFGVNNVATDKIFRIRVEISIIAMLICKLFVLVSGD